MANSKSTLGWYTTYELTERDGIHLSDISHQNYSFAKSISVACIWINPGTPFEKKLFLGTEQFDASVTGDKMFINDAVPPAPNNFSGFKTTSAFKCVFKSKKIEGDNIFGSDDEKSKLIITQTYLFTGYGNDPAHEPSGTLYAARIFPLIEIKTDNRKIASVRVDYRFHLSLDTVISGDKLKDLKHYYTGPPTDGSKYNQAGLFKDTDSIKLSGVLGFSGPFESAEKPLRYEIGTYGLFNGIPNNGEEFKEDDIAWDNIHWWNGKDDAPSAPGAFHAIHCHWRWSTVAQQKHWPVTNRFSERVLEHAGEKQFIGDYIGGPLLDPKVPLQTIRLVVEKNKYEDIMAISPTKDFFSSFKIADDKLTKIGGKDGYGKKIEGNDLILWYSVEVKSRNKIFPGYVLSPNGTIFIHGLYFAHDHEGKEAPAHSDFDNKPEDDEDVPKKWNRLASDEEL